MNHIFPKNMPKAKASKLESITLHGFGGGLNGASSDTTMDAQYQVTLNNFRRTASGSQVSRFGSNWFADVNSQVNGSRIVDAIYFASAIITPTDTGQIAAVDDNGVVAAIWNLTIANALPGAPDGWSTGLDSISFVPFKGQLIIHNGVDKPITVDANLDTTYLQDLATGSNVNTPIGKYGCVASNYHCIAGIAGLPTTIYISAAGTAGTFPGDPAPNDSISVDVGAYAPEGAPEIRAIAGFRSYLIVFFTSQTLLVKLGVYNSAGVHVPEFPDAMPSYGILNHRCIARVLQDLRFAGFSSVNSARRNLFSQIDSDTLSDIVEPVYRRAISNLTGDEILKKCFMLYDSVQHDTILYTPDGQAFVYTNNEKLKYKAWSTYTSPIWGCGCTSFLGRVFLMIGTRIFLQGNGAFGTENYRADRMNDRDIDWTQGHTFVTGNIARDVVTHESYICISDTVSGGTTFQADRDAQVLSPKWELYLGEPISVEMELPWIRGSDPMRLKQNRYISMVTAGDAPFTVSVWVDELYKNEDGAVVFDPALTMDFIANTAPGFGYDAGPYGGGRRSNDPRLFKFPVNFKSLKVIYTGSIRQKLEIANTSFLFARGRYRR